MSRPAGRGEGDPALAGRKLGDAAALLPIAGVILFLPPAASVFALGFDLAGVPLPVVYVFGVWALVILAAALLGRRLNDHARRQPDPPRDAGGD